MSERLVHSFNKSADTNFALAYGYTCLYVLDLIFEDGLDVDVFPDWIINTPLLLVTWATVPLSYGVATWWYHHYAQKKRR